MFNIFFPQMNLFIKNLLRVYLNISFFKSLKGSSSLTQRHQSFLLWLRVVWVLLLSNFLILKWILRWLILNHTFTTLSPHLNNIFFVYFKIQICNVVEDIFKKTEKWPSKYLKLGGGSKWFSKKIYAAGNCK